MPFKLINGLDLYNSEPQADHMLVDGLIYVGASFLAGEPKVGKSTMAMQLAYAVASGEPAFGRFGITNPGPVLICALEETAASYGSISVGSAAISMSERELRT